MKAFLYPDNPHVRKHGPTGYARYKAYKPWLRDEFTFRCAYCLMREKWNPNGSGAFSVDHFVPQVLDPDKTLDYDNLIYACVRCNSWKQDYTVLDPSHTSIGKHLQVNDDGTLKALTPEGAEHVEVLELNDPIAVEYRARLISLFQRLHTLGDADSMSRLASWLGFPDDLPRLNTFRPTGNTRPAGVTGCYFELRKSGRLPDTY